MIEGVIFDMDGLMFDTEGVWGSCWSGALAKYGYTEVPGFSRDARGTTGDYALSVIRRYFGEDAPAEFIFAEEKRLAFEVFERGVEKKPGLDELLAYLDEHGIPRAVASSSPRHMVEANLERANIAHLFTAVVSGEQVARSKPAPDIFLEAASRLGTPCERTLVLEDSFPGVEAGVAGGFPTVMIPDLREPDDHIRSIAAAVVRDMNEVVGLLERGELL